METATGITQYADVITSANADMTSVQGTMVAFFALLLAVAIAARVINAIIPRS